MDEVSNTPETEITDTRTGATTGTAPGPLPDNLYGPMPDWEFELTPSSTQVIMASLFLALGFTVNMQITERIDTISVGGVSPLWGLFFFALWNMAGAMFFGVSGAIIVANVNPIVANLTATNPLAPIFFATNTLYAVPMALCVWYLKKPGKGLRVEQLGFAHLLSIPLAVVPLAFIWIFILNFTPTVVAMWFVASCIFGWAGFFVAYPFAKKLLESGVVQ